MLNTLCPVVIQTLFLIKLFKKEINKSIKHIFFEILVLHFLWCRFIAWGWPTASRIDPCYWPGGKVVRQSCHGSTPRYCVATTFPSPGAFTLLIIIKWSSMCLSCLSTCAEINLWANIQAAPLLQAPRTKWWHIITFGSSGVSDWSVLIVVF